MTAHPGRAAAYLMLLWLAVYIGTGKACGDKVMSGVFVALCATVLVLPASAIEARSDATPQSGAAEGESATPKGDAQ
jgi:hypothetical protein